MGSNSWSRTLAFIILLILIIFLIMEYTDTRRFLRLNVNQSDGYDMRYRDKPRCDTDKRVVISMTTLPDNIDRIEPVISSLLDQSVQIDEIAINIPYISMKGDTYIIPRWLTKLENVKIYRTNSDEGPSTKILPTLKREKGDTIIIVVDDNSVYGRNMVSNMLTSFDKMGGVEAITNNGFDDVRNRGVLGDLYRCMFSTGYVNFLSSSHGYLVRPDMFPEEVFNYTGTPFGARWNDNIWISYWLKYNKVKIYSIGANYRTTGFSPLGSKRDQKDWDTMVKNREATCEWFKKIYSL